MNRVQSLLSQSLNLLFLIIVGFIGVVVMTFGFYNSSLINPIGMIVSGILAFFALMALHKLSLKSMEKINVNLLFVGLLGIFILIQVIFIFFFKVVPTWDFGHVVNLAEKAVAPRGWEILDLRWGLNEQMYVLYYPYNFALASVYTVIFYLFGTAVDNLFYFGIVCIALTQLFIFLFLKNNFSKATVIKTIGFMFVFYPYISYCIVPYTDVVALPFFACGLFLMIKNRQLQFSFPAILWFTMVIGLGSNFKILLIILAIAYAIVGLIRFQGIKKVFVMIPLCGYFIINLFFSSFWNQSTLTYAPYENAGITPLYFISLGLNLESMGQYNDKDYEESMSFASQLETGDTERVEAFYLDKIAKRLQVGPLALTELYYNKIFATFGRGDYGMSDYLQRAPFREESRTRVFFTRGFGKEMLFYYSEIFYFMMLIAMGSVAWLDRKNKEDGLMWQKTIFVGFFFYFMLFEAGPRYSILLTPLLFYFLAEFLEREIKISELKIKLKRNKNKYRA